MFLFINILLDGLVKSSKEIIYCKMNGYFTKGCISFGQLNRAVVFQKANHSLHSVYSLLLLPHMKEGETGIGQNVNNLESVIIEKINFAVVGTFLKNLYRFTCTDLRPLLPLHPVQKVTRGERKQFLRVSF